jgi:DNA-binding MarR family transcriptional regulator
VTDRLPAFDPVIHPPARLQIAAVLANVQEAEFALLRKTADVSDSVLSKHLSALAEAGYVKLRKAAVDGRQRTWASLTRTGRAAFQRHVAALTALAGLAEIDLAPTREPLLSPGSA